LLFVFGLCVGSFINCLVYRLNEGELRRSRSFCPKCKYQLAWGDNIPLLSFIFLRGKCRYCQSPISWQYPLVELGTGILTVVCFAQLGGVTTLTGIFQLFIVYCLIAIFVSDLLYFTIPDVIIWPAIVITFAAHLASRHTYEESLTGYLGGVTHLGGGTFVPSGSFLGGVMAAGFFLALVLITKGKGMGLGDVKLAGLMGLLLGWKQLVFSLYFAFLTGALIGVILILLKKKKLKDPVPFGPFLIAGTLLAMLW